MSLILTLVLCNFFAFETLEILTYLEMRNGKNYSPTKISPISIEWVNSTIGFVGLTCRFHKSNKSNGEFAKGE